MDELEFLMEIAASHAIQKYSSQTSAQKLQCLQYLVQTLMYKRDGAFHLDGSYVFVVYAFGCGQNQSKGESTENR